ncbi:MAG: hypothetical protein C4320_01880, partial [Armatimonadota bacterium]
TAHVDRATDALNAGDPKAALRIAEELRRANGPSADEALIRGIALSQLGEMAAASDALAEAIRQAPKSHKVQFNAAIHEFNAGNLEGAEELARRAALLDPEHGGTRDLLRKIAEMRPPVVPAVPDSRSAATGETLEWVGRLGSGWIAIAFVLVALGIAGTVLQMSAIMKVIPANSAASSFSEIFATSQRAAQATQRDPAAVLGGFLGLG